MFRKKLLALNQQLTAIKSTEEVSIRVCQLLHPVCFLWDSCVLASAVLTSKRQTKTVAVKHTLLGLHSPLPARRVGHRHSGTIEHYNGGPPPTSALLSRMFQGMHDQKEAKTLCRGPECTGLEAVSACLAPSNLTVPLLASTHAHTEQRSSADSRLVLRPPVLWVYVTQFQAPRSQLPHTRALDTNTNPPSIRRTSTSLHHTYRP